MRLLFCNQQQPHSNANLNPTSNCQIKANVISPHQLINKTTKLITLIRISMHSDDTDNK